MTPLTRPTRPRPDRSRPVRSAVALALGGAVLASSALTGVAAVSAEAAPKPKSYTNCTALNKVYPHGVGKKNAKDKVSGKSKPVTNFTRSDLVYSYNDGAKRRAGEKDLDRDNDGVACEKR